MAKFLNTSGASYYLEEMIKSAKDRLILISPYLKINPRIRELLEDKNRLKIDVRIVYGKTELSPSELEWLGALSYVRTSFCKNLHAKCYLNEDSCIITSLNLYEFSQVNNNEMGVFVSRSEDAELYRDTYEEVQRIIRVSEELSLIESTKKSNGADKKTTTDLNNTPNEKLTSTKLATKLKVKKEVLMAALVEHGYISILDGKEVLTEKGKNHAEGPIKGRFGSYFLWDADVLDGKL